LPDLALFRPSIETENALTEAALLALVLDGMTSKHSKRAYGKALTDFFAWMRTSYMDMEAPGFTKALVQEYRAALLERGLSASTINLRLSAVRKLARELADNGRLDPAAAAAIERAKGVERRGVRAGNWLLKDQVNELLQTPSATTRKGKRDRAILALLVACGLRRGELIALTVDQLQQREGRWVIPDLEGKGGRIRTIPIPALVKVRIDEWLAAAAITNGRIFRSVNKGDRVIGDGIADEKAIWRLVLKYAAQTSLGNLAPHDLRRTCAKLCRKAGGNLEQIQLLLGHASVATTERYLGTELDLAKAINDGLNITF
jgi:integrase/recombinase XerD